MEEPLITPDFKNLKEGSLVVLNGNFIVWPHGRDDEIGVEKILQFQNQICMFFKYNDLWSIFLINGELCEILNDDFIDEKNVKII